LDHQKKSHLKVIILPVAWNTRF